VTALPSSSEPFAVAHSLVVPPYSGRSVAVRAGTGIRIVDAEGQQVGDLFALTYPEPTEWLSVGHTRVCNGGLFPPIGGSFRSQLRRPLLTLVADTSPGVHDMLYPPCSPEAYIDYGVDGYHPSCRENFVLAVAAAGTAPPFVPDPVNLFQNTPVDADGTLLRGPSPTAPGDSVQLRAEDDLVVVLTSCSFDLTDFNGDHCTRLLIELDAPPLATFFDD
jgi:uncharacterized protein YcgI (DUF1989 family)